MKRRSVRDGHTGFTLIEVLVVIAIIGVLVAMLMPAMVGHPRHPKTAQCLSNLYQDAIGFIRWSCDHGDSFPWQVATTNGGTLEQVSSGLVSPHFRAIANSNYLRDPGATACPADRSRQPAPAYAVLGDTNISYFVGLSESTNSPQSLVLAGDRNLKADGRRLKAGLFLLSTNMVLNWADDQHGWGGNLVFADGHGESVKTNDLNAVFQRQDVVSSRLVLP